MAEWEHLLEGLDPEQRAVATAFGNPVAVRAGAGTGKTRALTHRIAYGSATGAYSPGRVLALTFTTRAAGELRARLAALDADTVTVRTFHSAALAQLNYFWPQLTGHPAPHVLDSKGRTLADVARRLRLTLDVATARDLAALIEWRKVRMLGITDLAERLGNAELTPPGRLTIEQTIDVMAGYETLTGERKQIDFEDVLLLTAGMLTDEPSACLQVREQYRHLLVDEYQDVSPVQHELLRLWLGERNDLCVVGDASQTIYRFAGASSSYLLGFESEFPNAQSFVLERNYRSAPAIVETANRLMNGQPGAITLRAQRTEPERPIFTEYQSDTDEARAVAAAIAEACASGTVADDIAVLYRLNAQSAPIERALHERGIRYRVRGGTPFFDRPEIRQALMQLRAEALSQAPNRPLFQVVSDVLWSLGWSTEEPPSGGAVRERWDGLNVLAELADAAPLGTTLRQFVDGLRDHAAQGTEPAQGAVTLATVHSAKGLEWDSVWLIGMSEGLLPVSYASDADAIAEERRLAYVALTRARRRLSVSWTLTGGRGRRRPSRFLAELGIRNPGVA